MLLAMGNRIAVLSSLSGIAAMTAAMIFGPILSPPEFSWIVHSTSQQAGQHTPGAWLMRLGFVGYGLGTLLASLSDRHRRPIVRAALAVFGAGLIATAIWSNASILPDVASDMAEDQAHSFASALVGAAFATACVARMLAVRTTKLDILALLALAVSVAIPIAMAEMPDLRGLLQRMMFVVSFVFVAREFSGQRGTEH